MDGLQMIQDQIAASAAAEADALLREARERADRTVKQAGEKAAALTQSTLQAANEAAQATVQRAAQAASMDGKKALLAHRQQLVFSVFDTVFEQLKSLPDDRYYALLKKLALAAQSEAGGGELLLNAADRKKYGENLAKETGLALSGDTTGIAGGVVLRNGRVEVNSSLEVVVRELREKNAYRVSQMLFAR